MKREIKKAKLTKGRTVDVTFVEHLDDKTEREHTVTCQQLFHDDLQRAFDKLKPHLVIICDQREAVTIGKQIGEDTLEMLGDIKVTSFVKSGNDETEGVVIVGQKKIGNKVLNLISPFVMFDDEEYNYGSELAADIDQCINEVEEYLNGKYAVKQLEMDFEETPNDPDSPEFDQETNTVANAVLSAVIEGKKSGKKAGKGKVAIELVDEAV